MPGEMVLPARRSGWPLPIGIVIIVLCAWTALSALSAMLTGAGTTFMAAGAGGAGSDAEEQAMMQVMADHSPFMIASGVLLLVAAGLGVAGGIGLVMRMRWGVTVVFVFALGKLAAAAFHAVVNARFTSDLMGVTMQGQPGAMTAGMQASMALTMALFSFAFGALLPAFLLIWLWMPNIRKDYKQW